MPEQKFLTNIELDGDLIDINGNSGTSGQVLSSLGSGNGVDWIDVTSDTAERIEVTVKNVSGGSLSKGTVVHASPSANPPSGNVIEVIAADYDDSTKMPAIGILNETIADTAEGSAVMMGAVSGIDTSSFSIGDELYVGNLGTLTNSKPATAGQLIQKIAVVIKSHASNGLIKIFGAGRSNDVPLPLYIDNANQRVGIGTSSPDGKLTIAGGNLSRILNFDIRATSVNNNQFPSIWAQDSSATGTFYNSQHGHLFLEGRANDDRHIHFLTGASSEMRMIIKGTGNVGIGTTSPDRPLVVSETRTGSTASDAYTTVIKSVQSSGASPNPGTGGLKVQYTSSSSNVHAFGLVAGSSSSDFLTTGPMHFYTNSDLDTVSATGFAMQLDTSQRLILGSMTASQKLNVSGNVTADRYYGNGSTVYYIDPNDGTQSANLTSKIRVGTGSLNLSSAPTWGVAQGNIFASTDSTNGGTATLMNVSSTYAGGDASGTLQFVIAGGNTSTTGGGYATAAITAISRNNPGSGTSGGGNLIFKTSVGYGSVSEKMRLTESGNLGIGVDPTEKLHVNGDFLVNNTSGAANGSAHEIARLINTTSGATSSYMYIGASSGNDWRIGKNILGTSGGSNFGIAKHSGSTLALEIDGSNNATVAGNVRAAGFTTDGNAKFYTWRALNNTSSSSNQYYRIARITATQSTRFIIELAGRSTSYTDGTIPAFGKIVGQLNNDNNYDIVYYNASATDEVVDEVGQVDVSTTATDIYIRVGQYAELTATAHISDGTITTYGGDSASTSAPTNYVQATEYKLWNTGNDGANSGLDADLLDGEQGSYYLNYNNFTNTPTIPSAYSHPTHPGDDITIDTGALTGATVISDLDFNITTDTLGHVTDANAAISTRTLTASDITTGTFNDLFAVATRYNIGLIDGSSSQTRDKIRVWNNSSYTIGMKSGFTYGHLNDYAMSFQMNDDNDRGFWWGDTTHTDAQGAMSLTTNGRLTVAESISIGQGASVTSPSTFPLYVDGTAVFDTTSGTEPVCITRSGSTSAEVLKIGVSDRVAQFNYIEDTSSEGTGNFGQYDFILGGNSSETSVTPLKLEKTKTTSNAGAFTFGTPGNGSNTLGRWLSFEGNTDSSGEGSGRLFFTEHNSSTTDMDDYGMSIGYRGGGTSVTTAGGNSWTGLSQISNGQWGMWGHDNSLAGALIMYGDRAATFVNFAGNNITGVNRITTTEHVISGNNVYAGGTQGFVFGSSTSEGEYIQRNGNNIEFVAGGAIKFDVHATNGVHVRNGSTYYAQISNTGVGRFGNDVVAYYNFSDKRLKTNIKPTANNLDKVLKLNPVEYNWKEGYRKDKKEIGLIAQEVEKIIPEVVRENQRLNDDTLYKQIDYEHLVSTLIGAVQEQQKQIDELKSIINGGS